MGSSRKEGSSGGIAHVSPCRSGPQCQINDEHCGGGEDGLEINDKTAVVVNTQRNLPVLTIVLQKNVAESF